MRTIKLLDCTLRDGGYLNDWKFGHNNIVNIFERLVSSGVDIIEVGFIDERREYDFNRTIFPDTHSINLGFSDMKKKETMLVGMIDYGTCSIEQIQPCEESILDGIRVIFKKHLRKEALDFCTQLKEKGYKVFAQLVSITSYNDEELMDLIRLSNKVQPYAVSMVDTYGLMHQENLLHYFHLLNAHLSSSISIGYHSHNNFQMAYANCIEFLAQQTERNILLDGTIYGMGKSAGNAPIELLAMHMNQHYEKQYDIAQILEAIDSSVMEFYRQKQWGYNMFYYIAASNDCHPNYVSYLMNKRTLSVKEIDAILKELIPDKRLLYDEQYIEKCYLDYQRNEINDEKMYQELSDIFRNRKILLLGPGCNIVKQRDRINDWLKDQDALKIAVNFMPEEYPPDYLFLTNSKRYLMLSTCLTRSDVAIISTSNVTNRHGEFKYILNYSSLIDKEASIVDNPLLMIMNAFKRMGVNDVYLAGFDGYVNAIGSNYVEQNMEYDFTSDQVEELNLYVSKKLHAYRKDICMTFLTDTVYDIPY
ncbi:putative uncharacterized protein [Clostridium sp. CAG:590]|nr:putative uncharacterized protein [Clostridium sp. CAG:590]